MDFELVFVEEPLETAHSAYSEEARVQVEVQVEVQDQVEDEV